MTPLQEQQRAGVRDEPGSAHEGEIPPAVSQQRWIEAQNWERTFWDRQNIPPALWKRALRPVLVVLGLRARTTKPAFDDRNYWWRAQFNDYADLPSRFENACELGCGPYSNIRLISEDRDIRYMHCSDPLAASYIRYGQAWVGRAHREGRVSVDFHRAEECPYRSDYFDLTILINVLDHVQDARRCLDEALRITAPGGYLVFGQDLTSSADGTPFNAGHPFVISHPQVEPLLDRVCDRVFYRLVPREEMHEPDMHYGALAYIGKKRALGSWPQGAG